MNFDSCLLIFATGTLLVQPPRNLPAAGARRQKWSRPAGLIEKDTVLQNFRHCLREGHPAAENLLRTSRANIDALRILPAQNAGPGRRAPSVPVLLRDRRGRNRRSECTVLQRKRPSVFGIGSPDCGTTSNSGDNPLGKWWCGSRGRRGARTA